MTKYNIIIDNTRFDMNLIWQIIEFRKEMPDMFRENIAKLSFYFMFPYSIWSKSKTERNYVPYENIESDLNRYEDNGCSLFFEFENTMIKPENFNEHYVNLILKTAKDKDVNAVVYNNELAKYIKEKYPYVKLVQSEIKREINPIPPYDMNVVDAITYNSAKDDIQNPKSIILAVNSFCNNSHSCANFLSSNKLNFSIEKPIQCIDKKHSFEEMRNNQLFISNEKMQEITNEGITNFLVKSNSDDRFQLLEMYLYYLIKPEHIDIMRLRFLRACFMNR